MTNPITRPSLLIRLADTADVEAWQTFVEGLLDPGDVLTQGENYAMDEYMGGYGIGSMDGGAQEETIQPLKRGEDPFEELNLPAETGDDSAVRSFSSGTIPPPIDR